ncbi:RagB/SusD family nutrient uptake outer membrane protein [Pedobacter sp. BS3]|uniref:RagB/SusD family nutrient uptake outer membrane protein n=1 Tax=Pedobacter sp. BS3 TaxID=2567937 RepID=UPI001658DDAE|nr:RagB/SusD family nutrient uptake outer membrane protein [Pedobacter sp. BS3]
MDTKPSDQVAEQEILSSMTNIRVALNGLYRALYMQYDGQEQDGQAAMMITLDFMGEDIVHSAAGTSYFRNSYKWINHRNVSSDLNYFAFRFYYRIIAGANKILPALDVVDGSETEKATVRGECLALRAWAHFQLVQIFAKRYDASIINIQPGVPIVTRYSLDPLPRATVEEVYERINTDLDSAIINLSQAEARAYKTHIDLSVAKGFKARVALVMQHWDIAAQYAAEAREGYSLMSNSEYLGGFTNLSNSEWMWGANQLADQLPAYGSFYAYMSANFNSAHTRPNPKLINTKLFALISSTDIRKKLWCTNVDDYVNFPGVINASTGKSEPTQVRKLYMHRKFLVKDPAVSAGDIPFMRAAEMYLIEAEAKAMQNDFDGAATALYPLAVNRDPNYVKPTQSSSYTISKLLGDILVQRRVELWGEGFRFLDLKRTNSDLNRTGTGATSTLANVLTVPQEDVRWQFLIPRREIEVNPMEQNP